MFNRNIWQFGALTLIWALLAGPTAALGQVTFTGDVTYRERMALPLDAELTVTLVRVDAGGTAHAIGATAPIIGPGQVPLHFVLDVRSDAIADNQTYGLVAEIRAQGVALFRNRQPVFVDPQAPLPVLIIVNFDPPKPVAAPDPNLGEFEVAAELFDTIWTVRSIAGAAVLASTNPTLSITSDRRAGGNGGCNNYFTEAMFDGSALRFGPVAGTRMACDTQVMEQEARFFATLGATADYKLTRSSLHLLDINGKQLAQLDRQ